MEEVWKAAQTDFEHISRVAKKEVKHQFLLFYTVRFIDCVYRRDMFFFP